MKAAVRSKYGSGKVLSIKEIEKPIPNDDEVLVRVYASAATRTDCHVLTGLPFIMRFFTGLFKPKHATTGTDFAGQIESVGKNINSFKPGDRIIGFRFWGASSHAYYLVTPEIAIIKLTDNIDYAGGAASVEGAFYAISGIMKLKPGSEHKALVYGATGAIGSAYVQFFKYYGTYVTAVCGGENAELVRSLGANKIIDYKTQDFTKDDEKYDFVIDAIGKSSFGRCKRLLKKNGYYAPSGGFINIFLVLFTSIFGGKKVLFTGPKSQKECLGAINDLVEKGSFKPVIDRKYPLEGIGEAFDYVLTGQKIGNVIITMED